MRNNRSLISSVLYLCIIVAGIFSMPPQVTQRNMNTTALKDPESVKTYKLHDAAREGKEQFSSQLSWNIHFK